MKKQSGFTLIELLMSVAIIAILAAVLFLAISGSQKKSRDAKRLSDLREIRNALEVYYSDNGSYPNNLSDLAPAYISSVPTPPAAGSQHAYAYARYGTYPDVTFYHLGAVLDNTRTGAQANCRSGVFVGGSAPQCVSGANATAGGFNGVLDDCTDGGSSPDLCYDITPKQ